MLSTGWMENLLEPTRPDVIKRRYAWATWSCCGFGHRSLSLGRCDCELGTQPLVILIITLEEAQDSCVLKKMVLLILTWFWEKEPKLFFAEKDFSINWIFKIINWMWQLFLLLLKSLTKSTNGQFNRLNDLFK